MAVGLPLGWGLIDYGSTSADSDANAAHSLLMSTFPRRYRHLAIGTALHDKIVPRKISGPIGIPSLLIFRRQLTTSSPVDMCAFFFLRYWNYKKAAKVADPGYTMTVGVDPAINPNGPDDLAHLLHHDLTEVCRHMQDLIPNDHTLEVVNERDLPRDFDEDVDLTKPGHPITGGADIVRRTFSRSVGGANITMEFKEDGYSAMLPWVPELRRYTIKNPLPIVPYP